MAEEATPGTIEAILSKKAIARPQLTPDEWRVIASEFEKLIEESRTKAQSELTESFRAWSELSKTVQQMSAVVDVRKIIEEFRKKPSLPATALAEPNRPIREFGTALPAGCFLTFEMHPPYDQGDPVEEDVADVEPPDSPFSVFKSRSRLSLPASGDLSLGVATGRFGDSRYPASKSWFFGEYHDASALFIKNVILPGPIDKPTAVTVTINVRVGDPSNPYATTHLAEGDLDSALGGTVGVNGWIYLYVYGWPSFHVPPPQRKMFLEQRRSAFSDGSWGTFNKYFSLTGSLLLLPGASSIWITVHADLWAVRGGFDDPKGGFAGVDFRAPGTHGLWFLQPAGGPIHVSAMQMTFCHFTLPLSEVDLG